MLLEGLLNMKKHWLNQAETSRIPFSLNLRTDSPADMSGETLAALMAVLMIRMNRAFL